MDGLGSPKVIFFPFRHVFDLLGSFFSRELRKKSGDGSRCHQRHQQHCCCYCSLTVVLFLESKVLQVDNTFSTRLKSVSLLLQHHRCESCRTDASLIKRPGREKRPSDAQMVIMVLSFAQSCDLRDSLNR